MTLDEFQLEDDSLLEISRKLSNVTIGKMPTPGEELDKSAVRGDSLTTTEFVFFMPEFLLIFNQ